MQPLAPGVVANYFLDRAIHDGRALTPMQVLKLVYIAHGWHLGYGMGPLINEEVQAWKHGPVIQSLYSQLRKYGGSAVRAPVQTGPMPWMVSAEIPNDRSRALIDKVWQEYGHLGGFQLSEMTHRKGTPWWNAWVDNNGANVRYAPISDKLIQAHYAEKLAAAQ